MIQAPVRVVGAGLIGTSIALRLRELKSEVEIDDQNPTARDLARDLLGGGGPVSSPALIVVATPPESISETLREEFKRNPQSTFIDVGSTKLNLQREVDSFPELASRFVGTHPIAGREHSGAQSARSDLFLGRAWILTPSSLTTPEQKSIVAEFIRAMGSTPYEMSPKEHDQLLAEISHLPQILSTALAVTLAESGAEIDLSGQGLRDMLRLAGSNGKLWREILQSNSYEVIDVIAKYERSIGRIRSALENNDGEAVEEMFSRGNELHSKLSGKHGAKPREYSHVSVVIEDKPGQLGALFNECASIDANVEDLMLEHSPRQETGLIRLALSKSDALRLHKHLIENNWRAHLQ